MKAVLALLLFSSLALLSSAASLGDIKYVVILYLENWSFDGLFGDYPGANGISSAPQSAKIQIDAADVPYAIFPQYEPTVPQTMENGPFDLTPFVPRNKTTNSDVRHRFYHEIRQLNAQNNGPYQMNKFVLYDDQINAAGTDGLTMSYYPSAQSLLRPYVQEGALLDNYFHGFFGGSWPNANHLVCACAAIWNTTTDGQPPSVLVTRLERDGWPKDMIESPLGPVEPDGNYYFINNLQSKQWHQAPSPWVPAQTHPTIGHRMDDKNVEWVWYSAGWKAAFANRDIADYDWHHQAFAYYERYDPSTVNGQRHHKDVDDLFTILREGTHLPTVSFIKLNDSYNTHPKSSGIEASEYQIIDVFEALKKSKFYSEMAVLVTWDENGGRWDHVPPPKVDRWGPGARVPFFILSPFAKKGFIDHTYYETTSIHKFLNRRFGLEPLPGVRPDSGDLTNAFVFGAASKAMTSSGLLLIVLSFVLIIVM